MLKYSRFTTALIHTDCNEGISVSKPLTAIVEYVLITGVYHHFKKDITAVRCNYLPWSGQVCWTKCFCWMKIILFSIGPFGSQLHLVPNCICPETWMPCSKIKIPSFQNHCQWLQTQPSTLYILFQQQKTIIASLRKSRCPRLDWELLGLSQILI